MGKLISVLLAIALLLLLIPATAVTAADTGTSSGSFSVGSVAPSVTVLEIYSDAACNTVASALTPQVTYYVKVTAGDANTLNNIKEIVLKIYYDANATHPLESTIVSGNEQTAGIFTWEREGSTHWTVNAGAGATWAVIAAESKIPTVLTNSSGDWVFAIKLGKVATESLSPAVWNFYAMVKDDEDHTAGLYHYDNSVLWYGETTVVTGTIAFGETALGSGFADNTNEVNGVQVKYIANGNYSVSIKSSATWEGVRNIATLDPNGLCENQGQFALKTYGQDIIGSAKLLNTTGVVVRDTGTQTLESGYTTLTGTFWLKIANSFNVDVYNGTITFTIVNRE